MFQIIKKNEIFGMLFLNICNKNLIKIMFYKFIKKIVNISNL